MEPTKKYTVITGASSGIGRETAKAFADRGKNLIVAARRTENLEALKREILEQHPTLDVVIRTVDLSVLENVYQFYSKEWAIRMREKGFSFQSISNYKRSLRAAFFIAIEDDCVRKNPFSFALNKVLEDDRGEKTVLTPEQEVSLIDFAQNDPVYQKYADELIILLGTGLRISEFCGLTTNLDFKNRLIRVDHQLLRDSKNGYYIETPKTKNGYREIPMSEPVYRALKRVVKNRGKKATITVDGYTNFLFLKKDGTPRVGANYNAMIKGLACYDDEINRLATVKERQSDGSMKVVVDEDMRQQLILKLLEAIPQFPIEGK